mgnify:CR=1 FL=1
MLLRSFEQGVGRIVVLWIEVSGDAALVRMICAHPEFGRELLRNPSWARHAARELGGDVHVPQQYHRSV